MNIRVTYIGYICLSLMLTQPGSKLQGEADLFVHETNSGIPGYIGQTQYLPTSVSPWPARGVSLRTSTIGTSLSSGINLTGFFGGAFGMYGGPSFEYPMGSGIEYLRWANLWVGGIINGDTLVSTSYVNESTPFNYYRGWEMLPRIHPEQMNSVVPISSSVGTTLRSEVNDTVVYDGWLRHLLPGLDFEGKMHQPMNISVVAKASVIDIHPYRNMILLDYTITNEGTDTIVDAAVGLYVDGVVGAPLRMPDGSYQRIEIDDLVGTLADLQTAYVIDNDGDPVNGIFANNVSAIDGLGVRLVRIEPPAEHINFNWWDLLYETDYGPRQRGTEDDPYFTFRTGGTGLPSGDVNKYYMMTHPEWDFDQVQTALLSNTDSVWMPPHIEKDSIADGMDTRFLLSAGTFPIPPGGHCRVAFVLFAGEFVHIDPSNGANLSNQRYNEYINNLSFSSLRESAINSIKMADTLLNPIFPPTGLHVIYLNADTVRLAWDPFLFDGVHGYNVYLTKIPNSLHLTPSAVHPSFELDSYGSSPVTVSPDSNSIEITGLDPYQFYAATICHLTDTGEGQLSLPIVVGYGNDALQLPPPVPTADFFFVNDDDPFVTIAWYPVENENVSYYKIYKFSDSIEAANRHHPYFVFDTTGNTHHSSRYCATDGPIPYCYYEMHAYDSVPASQTVYLDRQPMDDCYYWITAVDRPGRESHFSSLIRTDRAPKSDKEILVILGSHTRLHDFVIKDSLFAFYNRLLSGYSYDLYDWGDSNLIRENCESGYCTSWDDIARYKLVIVEEFPSSKILQTQIESNYQLLARIVSSGRDLAYFGTPPGNTQVNLSSQENSILYAPDSFEKTYMHLDSSYRHTWFGSYATYNVSDTLGGFTGAQSQYATLPNIHIDTNSHKTSEFLHQLFNITNYSPLVPAFYPSEDVDVLYRYNSAFPKSSTLQDLPCGILTRHPGSNVYCFSFHLWSIEDQSARALVDYIIQNQAKDTSLIPAFFPTNASLTQNYPNPFNSSTVISFDLERQTQVSLSIYNILGQEVVNLINRPYREGRHSIIWDGDNAHGRPVATGIYFYRITTDDAVQTKKMLLVK